MQLHKKTILQKDFLLEAKMLILKMFSVQDDSIENQLSLTKHESNFFSFGTKNILLKMI